MEKWVSFEKMVPRKLIDKRVLDNGVTVYFYDKSRKVVGDRMEVRLLIEIPVRVRKEYFENLEDGEKAYREFVESHGEVVFFRIEKIRNFIDQNEAPEILAKLKTDFASSALDYISRGGFERSYIQKRYRDWQEEVNLNKKIQEALDRSTMEERK